jgi:hypothetical protein
MGLGEYGVSGWQRPVRAMRQALGLANQRLVIDSAMMRIELPGRCIVEATDKDMRGTIGLSWPSARPKQDSF